MSLAFGVIVMVCLDIYLIEKTTGIADAKNDLSSEEVNAFHRSTSTCSTTGDIENMGNNVAISCKSLRKTFTRADGKLLNAVDGLTVDFYENQITSFLGHNGAGKSTTISLLTGLFNVDSGDAKIKGLSIVKEMEKVRPLLGVCPQANILWDLLSVKDHMKLFSRIRGISDQKATDDIKILLKDIGLEDKQDTWAKDLSGGQKRKLQTACALIGDPAIVFLDEPTAGMDSSARRDMWDLLLKKKKGKSSSSSQLFWCRVCSAHCRKKITGLQVMDISASSSCSS